jgi:hypothetical protein
MPTLATATFTNALPGSMIWIIKAIASTPNKNGQATVQLA